MRRRGDGSDFLRPEPVLLFAVGFLNFSPYVGARLPKSRRTLCGSLRLLVTFLSPSVFFPFPPFVLCCERDEMVVYVRTVLVRGRAKGP